MTIKLHYIAPLLALGAIAAAITTTADASAATHTCADAVAPPRAKARATLRSTRILLLSGLPLFTVHSLRQSPSCGIRGRPDGRLISFLHQRGNAAE